jgi:hypothetical protein
MKALKASQGVVAVTKLALELFCILFALAECRLSLSSAVQLPSRSEVEVVKSDLAGQR